jgi:hypothetical protein
LLARLRLGREEYCQRLLTMLALDGPYPKWNTESPLAPEGTAFFESLDAASFGTGPWQAAPAFVDEFDLPARDDQEPGGAPDYALIWPDRLWMIELKTERASHRGGQLDQYLTLARHHHPGRRIDLTYLTPAMPTPAPETHPGVRFAHLTWDGVRPLIESSLGSGSPAQRAACGGLLSALDSIGRNWSQWRAEQLQAAPPALAAAPSESVPPSDDEVLAMGLQTAERTAHDGMQRGLDIDVGSLQGLKNLRMLLKGAIGDRAEGDPVRQVRLWLWQAGRSGGSPLTGFGVEYGYELRASRYQSTGRERAGGETP